MTDFLNSVKGTALSIAEALTPVLKESKFRETGVLTPDEFVAAGDHLVHLCPTWQWSAAQDNSHTKAYLPADKQYLVTKSVPCHRRCADMEYDVNLEEIIDEDEEGGWVDTHHNAPANALSEAVGDMSVSDNKTTPVAVEDADEEEACDMDDFDFSNVQDEDKNAEQPTSTAEVDNRLGVRTYDLNITYDRYYQVPRLWLWGFDEKRRLLSVEQMYEDFSADHARKTITMESHPHISGPVRASVHPCKHAHVMKRLMDQMGESGKELNVLQYLIIFLKFMQAVIPTIDYDYTKSIQL